MSGATGPIVPLSQLSSAELLACQVEAAAAEFREAQVLYRRLLDGETVPTVEVIDHSHRIADLDLAIRKGTMFEVATRSPLAAVPGPGKRRGRHARPQGDRAFWPVIVRDEGDAGG